MDRPTALALTIGTTGAFVGVGFTVGVGVGFTVGVGVGFTVGVGVGDGVTTGAGLIVMVLCTVLDWPYLPAGF